MTASQGSINYGDTTAQKVSQRHGGQFADKDDLASLGPAFRVDGMLSTLASDRSTWVFVLGLATAEDEARELLIAPDSGSGRWVRADKAFVMKVPISFANTDNQAIETMPEGFALRLGGFPYWEITTPFAGGTASAIGISTSVTGYDTEGDILGGATGDTTAVESAGIAAGTLGGELDDHVGFQALLLEEGQAFRYNRIVDAYTSGAGYFCQPVFVATAPATP